MSTTRVAAVAACGLAGIAAFQIALALGARLGRAAWGGTYAQLPVKLRIGSAVSAAFLSAAAIIVLGRGGYCAGSGWVGLCRWGTWALVFFLGLSAFANFASASRWENFLMGPIALVLSLLCLLVALSPARAARGGAGHSSSSTSAWHTASPSSWAGAYSGTEFAFDISKDRDG